MDGLPLDLAHDDRLELGRSAFEFVEDFLSALSGSAASYPALDQASLDALMQAPGRDGETIEDLLAMVKTSAESGFNTTAGSHLSYIPNGGIFSGAIGEFIGATLNQYSGGAHAASGAVAIEQGVINWMLELFGLGSDGAGILLSGGSIANQTAIVAARTRFGEDFGDGVIYTSERAHHSIAKAARLSGIASGRVREVSSDARLKLDIDHLQQLIAQDIAAGLRPMAVIATAGTTDAGSIDPLNQIADIAASHGAWSHADAAYGGFFQLTGRGAERLAGIERFDSITVDAHKSLFMPYGIGCLLVSDGDALVQANTGIGSYMQDVVDISGLAHPFMLGPELTRPFRGLPVWLGLHLHGVAAFEAELDRMLNLAETAHAELKKLDRLVVLGEPELSVVVFRSRLGDADTRLLLEQINASRKVHISSTEVHGHEWLRLAFLNPRTTRGHLDIVIDLIQTAE